MARTNAKPNNLLVFEEAREAIIKVESLSRVLTPAELETLEILFDKHATGVIAKSLQEEEERKVEPITEIFNLMQERYRAYITPSARKETKRLPKQVRGAILDAVLVLEAKPYAGERLPGSLHMLYSFHVPIGQSQYQIAYALDHFHQLGVVHLVNSRESLYKKLKRLFH